MPAEMPSFCEPAGFEEVSSMQSKVPLPFQWASARKLLGADYHIWKCTTLSALRCQASLGARHHTAMLRHVVCRWRLHTTRPGLTTHASSRL